MGIKHIPDGQDFGPEHFSKDFGFHGSANGPDFPDTRGPKHVAEPDEEGGGDYARGGKMHRNKGMMEEHMMRRGGHEEHRAHGGHTVHHPDGRITHHHEDGGHHTIHPDGRVEHHHAHGGHSVVHPDGRIIHHHAHGGHTEHHPDGKRIEHHADGGRTVHHISGEVEHHDGSTYVGRHGMHEEGYAHGGHHEDPDAAQDKAMIKKAFRQHENAEHHGEHEELHLARGGVPNERPRFPRSMRPRAESLHSPINTPPRNPKTSRTQPNMMPGGEMAYGVQPSDEAGGMAGPDESMTSMAHGGHMRHRR
jgi:hypothetical protein